MHTKTFRVQNNRIRFVCPECGTKRVIAVAGSVRRRNIKCPKCSVATPCILNRRSSPRELQAGRCLLIFEQGNEMEIDLHDISIYGLGFNIPQNSPVNLHLRQLLRFKCSWGPRLLTSKYIVRSIKGRRIGAQRL